MIIEAITVFLDTDILESCDFRKSHKIKISDDAAFNSKVKLQLVISELVLWEYQKHYIDDTKKAVIGYNSHVKDINFLLNIKKRFVGWQEPEVLKKVRLFIIKSGISIIKIPLEGIDIRELAKSAAFYTPPFTEIEDGYKEKGFKDYVIAETAIQFANTNPKNKIVIISRDKNLRAYAKTKSDRLNNFSVFKSIKEFVSTEKLLLEELDKKVIGKLLRDSKEIFTNSIYLNSGLELSLISQNNDLFNKPDLNKRQLGLLAAIGYSNDIGIKNWEPVGDGRFTISETEYIKRIDEDHYYWTTNVTYQHRYREICSSIDAEKTPEHVDYTVDFPIHWESEVSIENLFTNIRLTKIGRPITSVQQVSWFNLYMDNLRNSIQALSDFTGGVASFNQVTQNNMSKLSDYFGAATYPIQNLASYISNPLVNIGKTAQTSAPDNNSKEKDNQS
jgi:hypothetical protein